MDSVASVMGAVMVAALVLVGCGGQGDAAREAPTVVEESVPPSDEGTGDEEAVEPGQPADVAVEGTDRIEVRRVISGEDRSSHDVEAEPETTQHQTAFGLHALTVGTIEGGTLDELVATVAQAIYLDTGEITYDLVNPDYEVIFFREGQELARLGHYGQPSGVGTRWMDQDWALLDMAFDLPPNHQ